MMQQYTSNSNQLGKQKLSNLNTSATTQSRHDSVENKKMRKKQNSSQQPPIARLSKKSTAKHNQTVIESGRAKRLSEISGRKSGQHSNSRRKSRDAATIQAEHTSIGFAIKENKNSIANRTLTSDALSATHNFSTIGPESGAFFNDRSQSTQQFGQTAAFRSLNRGPENMLMLGDKQVSRQEEQIINIRANRPSSQNAVQHSLQPTTNTCETPKFLLENAFKSSGALKVGLKDHNSQENFRSIQVESQGQGQVHHIPLA